MKKLILIALLIVGCDKIDKKETENSSLEFWEIKYFVNQDNEPTDVGYITNANPIIGEFSTSKILNNALKVKIMIKERAVGIKLYENEQKLSVKGNKQDPIEYDIKVKRNDENIDFIFRGINETDLVVVGNIISSSHQDTLIHYLKMGGKFDFYLETKNQRNNKVYEFDINDESPHGFINTFNKLKSN
tara:strand:+ start:29 stop:592 length:564 start_codon:yes stop_codon:yes gene_type:complete